MRVHACALGDSVLIADLGFKMVPCEIPHAFVNCAVNGAGVFDVIICLISFDEFTFLFLMRELGHKCFLGSFDGVLFKFLILNWGFMQIKFSGDEVSVDKRRRIGSTRTPSGTVGRTQARQAFSVVNGGQDPAPNSRPPSSSGSDCGVIEFTKEDVEALLSEKTGSKNKISYAYKVSEWGFSFTDLVVAQIGI